jgi:predicted Holliday junction resolvase-like endonuclease
MHQDIQTTDVALLSAKLQTLHTDVSDIKGSLKDLAVAINKLALVEERLSNATAAQERSFKALEKLEERIAELEKKTINTDNTSKWIDRGLVAALGAFFAFIWERVRNG